MDVGRNRATPPLQRDASTSNISRSKRTDHRCSWDTSQREPNSFRRRNSYPPLDKSVIACKILHTIQHTCASRSRKSGMRAAEKS